MAFEREEDVARYLPRYIDSYNGRRLRSALGYPEPQPLRGGTAPQASQISRLKMSGPRGPLQLAIANF